MPTFLLVISFMIVWVNNSAALMSFPDFVFLPNLLCLNLFTATKLYQIVRKDTEREGG
jgi:hypothetical protein